VTTSSHGPVSREMVRILAHLPERVRIVWPHHQLCGTELVVHSWQRIDGEVHLRLTLNDGSIGCLPAAWTDLFEMTADGQLQQRHTVSLAGLRSLRALMQALSGWQAAGNSGDARCCSA
jgi:hypothetical protein